MDSRLCFNTSLKKICEFIHYPLNLLQCHTLKYILYIVSAINCGQPAVENAHLVSNNEITTVGSRLFYECDTGYSLGHYSDISFSIQCQDNGTWTEIPLCGKFKQYIFL